MGYRLNRPNELVFIAGPKPMQTEFGIHHRLESCVSQMGKAPIFGKWPLNLPEVIDMFLDEIQAMDLQLFG